MGIKGIYTELGQGKRVALSKLSADCIVNHGRPLRLAIDFAIWQFQAQAARGGTNPAIRTLFYRLARLLGTPVEPIFVFDGPEKPQMKRNKKAGRGDALASAQAKRLIRLFGFPVHDAPGEAEAECALLQRRGIVDAVLSEDVDTIMFGCTKTLRNWSNEGTSSKTPTHVTMYDLIDGGIDAAELGLDREGMVLVALMSGGDYAPAGIPKCGVKIAREAAKAGFGKSVCRLKASDSDGVQAWRQSLIHELQTNEQGFFRTKRMALALSIPDNFPDFQVLRYYTHPAVSPASSLDAIRKNMDEKRTMQLEGLREFARETFGWDFRVGAIKFIKVLSQPLLAHKIRTEPSAAGQLVKKITGRRTAFSTDTTPELRMSFVPEEIVPIDLSQEVEENIASSRDGLALNSDDEVDPPTQAVESSTAGASTGTGKVYDTSKPDLAWVLEGLVRTALPGHVSEWEESELAKAIRKSPKKKKSVPVKAKKGTGMQHGALDQYMRISKSGHAESRQETSKKGASPERSTTRRPHDPTSPSRLSSKPPRPPATAKGKSPDHDVDEILARSQVTPRTIDAPGRPETIVISSSPAAAPVSSAIPSSPPASPSPGSRTRRTIADVEDVPGSIRSILSASGSSKGVREQGLRMEARETTISASSVSRISQGRNMKQMSMDSFAKRLFPPIAAKGALPNSSQTYQQSTQTIHDVIDDANSSDLEPISSLATSPPPARQLPRAPHKRNKSQTTLFRGSDSPRTAPRTKKKLFVPRSSDAGFFKEIEVEVDEHEDSSERLEAKGVRRGAVRYSDVSVIDLTREDE